jgi:Glycosyltransferase family 87
LNRRVSAQSQKLAPSSPRIAIRPRTIGILLALVTFAWFWALLGVYGERGSSDTYVYRQYALEIRSGEVPYRDFAVEYPPGALVAFLGPSYLSDATSLADYSKWFGRSMALLGLCGVLLVAWLRRTGAVVFVALSPILIGSLAETRFDVWPAVLCTAAVLALLAGRHRIGWSFLGLAFAAKLYAFVVVPLAVVMTLRRRGPRELARAAGCGALVVLALYMPFVVLAPHGLWESMWRQASRPLEIESLAATYLKTFAHPQVISAEGALAIAGHGTLAGAVTVVGIGVLIALWALFAGGLADDDSFLRYAAACVTAFIAFGKVISPQYLIWLVPLVPLVRGRRGIAAVALLVASLVATDFVWYGATRFDDYAFGSHWAWLLLIRDLTLVALVGVLGFPGRSELTAWRGRRRPAGA